MEKEQRTRLQKATQDARRLLEEEFAGQLLETYDINVDKGRWSEEPGAHLQAEQRLIREKLLAWIEHKEAQINDRKEALLLALREMAFTALNRFVALKLMEARELVRPCVSGGLESEGFQEFTAVAQGLLADQEGAYRLYLETIFEDVSRELRALFDPRDPASLLWPNRTALLELLDILNRPELAELWREDETLGWIYQYFNGDAERKKMREESSAPRNSRELAVRNQFFTPRYVVEFLTDNTLGRIWYEMRQGNTGLKERCRYLVRRPNEIWLQPGEEAPAEVVADEALSQEELLRQPVHIPNRPLKDPREIRMLDPACGSMHFGLYAFDLYLAIYEEAWEIAQGSDEQAKQGEAFAAFAAGFVDKAAFWSEVPRLILLHNIHGVDIDPRATQIARLTLWLRAQRAWQEQGVEVAARPAISRSNVVCAEPMPGEQELLADFVDEQFPEAERGLVRQLLETIFDKMQLASEAVSLLKIEEDIRDAIDQARREWQKLAIHQRDLFGAAELAALGGVGSSLNTDLQNLTKDFWVTIEERIYDALRDYADQAESGGYQRRLFAEDAAQGFAFIDICKKRYDVALMNPPFGEWAQAYKQESRIRYPVSYMDILAAFVDRGCYLLIKGGLLGAITSRTCLFLSSFSEWRNTLLLNSFPPVTLGDLGFGVMDGALVEAAAYVLEHAQLERSPLTTCFRLQKSVNKGMDLSRATAATYAGIPDSSVYLARSKSFESIPNSPFAYWVNSSIHRIFRQTPEFENSTRYVRQGLATADDFRFVRAWWEIPQGEAGMESQTWFPLSKGGGYSPFYCELSLCVNWRFNGRELRCFGDPNGIRPSSRPQNTHLYFRPGLTWPSRPHKRGAFSLIPSGVIFSHTGTMVFAPLEELEPLCSILNSDAYIGLLHLLMPRGGDEGSGQTLKYELGYVKSVPIPDLQHVADRLTSCAKECWGILRHISSHEVTSRFFVRPALCRGPHDLHESISAWQAFKVSCEERLAASQAEINSISYGLYGINSAGREALGETLGTGSIPNCIAPESEERLISALLDYIVGIAFGRWNIATRKDDDIGLNCVNPFEEIPLLPPGQLGGSGASVRTSSVDSGGSLVNTLRDGVLVDDPGSHSDIVDAVSDVIRSLWEGEDELGETTIKAQMARYLEANSFRNLFSRPASFFADHLCGHSKSRRQAPIYWQLSAGNGGYSAWLYYHRFTQDTLYRVLRDFIEPRIQEVERDQFELESQGGLSGDAAGLLHEVQALLQDLRLFKSELELVAPLWNPNLNDGVIINHAILWRITPYTPWQKKCKECWDKLVQGDYDWAHLAFHLWPERVIRKCTTDRSLAIAHGLEERLWQETSKGSWLQRQLPEAELQALLAEYSKPAVQNALERFLAAPPPVAAARTRAPRATKSASAGTTRRPRGSAPAVDAEASRQTLLVLTGAPAEGLGRNAIADLLDVDAASLTAVIKQLKEGGQIEQLGTARGAKYRLSEQGRAAVESQAGEDD